MNAPNPFACPSIGLANEWIKNHLDGLVDRLVASCDGSVGANLADDLDLPSREAARSALDSLHAVLFPGYATGCALSRAELPHALGLQLAELHRALSALSARAYRYACRGNDAAHCGDAAQAAGALLEQLPDIRETLKQDMASAYAHDPAARSYDEILLCYPCINAIATYRLAHVLHTLGVPLIPRLWTACAHARTGIDIHPGAQIAPGFFIDHGTGVVIGETAIIGREVTLYQGVTLGAMAPAKGQKLAGQKRHPTLEDEVVVYAGATILGGDTVVGRGAVIGGNTWVTSSVPAGAKVSR